MYRNKLLRSILLSTLTLVFPCSAFAITYDISWKGHSNFDSDLSSKGTEFSGDIRLTLTNSAWEPLYEHRTHDIYGKSDISELEMIMYKESEVFSQEKVQNMGNLFVGENLYGGGSDYFELNLPGLQFEIEADIFAIDFTDSAPILPENFSYKNRSFISAYFRDFGFESLTISDFNVSIADVAPVPIPGGLVLLFAPLASMIYMRRKNWLAKQSSVLCS